MKRHLIFSIVGLSAVIMSFVFEFSWLILIGIFFLAWSYKDFNDLNVREILQEEIAKKKS